MGRLFYDKIGYLFKKISTFVFTMIFVLTLTATANATITVTHEPESLTFANNSATMTFNISGFATGQEFEKTTYAIEHVTGISVRSTDYINGNSIASKVTFTKSTSIDSFPITVTVWYKENGETKNVKSNCSIMCYDSSYSQTTTKDDQVVGDQTTKLVTTDDIKIEYVGESTIMVGRNKPVSLPFKITSEKYNLREITFEPVAQSRGKYSISNVSDDDGSPERNIMCNVVAETDDLPTLVILVTVNYINGSERAYMIRTFDNIKVTMNPNDSIYNPDYDGIADGVYGDPDTLAEILNINDGIGVIIYELYKLYVALYFKYFTFFISF